MGVLFSLFVPSNPDTACLLTDKALSKTVRAKVLC